MQTKKNVSRRDLLKMLGSLPATVPVVQLLDLLMSGALAKASAASITANGKRYAFIMQGMAPARWVWELPLTPYDTSKFVRNPCVGTVGVLDATNSYYETMDYKTSLIKGVNLPPLWGASVPDAGGVLRPISTLLDNFLCIRGVDVGAPGHGLAQTLSFRPIGAEFTITGLVAEAGMGFPIKCVNLAAMGFEFNARQPLSATTIPPFNGVNTGNLLLNPFKNAGSSSFNSLKTNAAVKSKLDAAQVALNNFAKAQHGGSEILRAAQADAQAVMGSAVDAILTRWNSIHAKYVNIVKQTMLNSPVPGVFDKPFGKPGRVSSDTFINTHYRVNDTIMMSPTDLRSCFTATSSVVMIAESFAMLELALTENLSNSIAVGIGNIRMSGSATEVYTDEHGTSGFMSLIMNTKRSACIASCLLELVASVKAAGIWNDTLIHVGGEFNRSPQANCMASDHGFQAQSAAFFGGMINGPQVIGNTLVETGNTQYPGSWGVAAPVPQLGGRTLDAADLANAIGVMMGVGEVVRRGETQQVVQMVSGKVASKIGNASQS